MSTYNEIVDLINENLESGSKIPAVKHREVEIALLDYIQANSFQSGDIKLIYITTEQLAIDFEANGLGLNLRLGWAICNGNNGAIDLTGKVPIHYSADFPLNTSGGSKDAVVVEHSHTGSVTVQNISSGSVGNNIQGTGQTQSGGTYAFSTSPSGVSGINKNMQPYLSMVYIQKL